MNNPKIKSGHTRCSGIYACVILALRKQEEHKFKISLDYRVEPNLKNNKLRF